MLQDLFSSFKFDFGQSEIRLFSCHNTGATGKLHLQSYNSAQQCDFKAVQGYNRIFKNQKFSFAKNKPPKHQEAREKEGEKDAVLSLHIPLFITLLNLTQAVNSGAL